MYWNYVVWRIWHIKTKYEHSEPQIAEKIRTFWASNCWKNKNIESEQNFTGSYKKVYCMDVQLEQHWVLGDVSNHIFLL